MNWRCKVSEESGEVYQTEVLTVPYDIMHDPETGKYWWHVPTLMQDSFDEFDTPEGALADAWEMFDQ